jgi:hypothetical protein
MGNLHTLGNFTTLNNLQMGSSTAYIQWNPNTHQSQMIQQQQPVQQQPYPNGVAWNYDYDMPQNKVPAHLEASALAWLDKRVNEIRAKL